MVATLALGTFGVATAQLWFVTMMGLEAVAFGLLCRSSPTVARRPAFIVSAESAS